MEKYNGSNSRYNCPNCGHEQSRTFSKYIDVETGNYLHDNVGRCNREDKCGYHYTPKQYFEDQGLPVIKQTLVVDRKPELQPSFLPLEFITLTTKIPIFIHF
ncbi:PG0870-related protein [Carboxylicivirga sp. RSCT41]|uniref:PG0870-related protein n=1 Tax=Carboxylicivirga agarovorans TaxID=3417570 RepID=UPI003D348022